MSFRAHWGKNVRSHLANVDLLHQPSYSVRMREYTDQKNSEYGHILHNDTGLLAINANQEVKKDGRQQVISDGHHQMLVKQN